MYTSLSALVFSALIASASASSSPRHWMGEKEANTDCDLSQAKLTPPPGLAPPSHPTTFIGFAFGTQNYTCGQDGKYATVGAVAQLFDVSCWVHKPEFASLPDTAIHLWESATNNVTFDRILSAPGLFTSPQLLGQHYFVNFGPQNALSAKWDFTAAEDVLDGDTAAFVTVAKVANISAPTGKQDIDWLQTKAADPNGKLADEVYRTDTRKGQPPSSCTPGSAPIQVKYVSNYWFFGGSESSKKYN